MNKKMTFIVEEVSRKEISIECGSIEDGKIQISNSYDDGEIQLDYDDLWATNIYTKAEIEIADNLSKEHRYLSKPLTAKEVHAEMDIDGYISGVVAVSDTELYYDNNYDNLIDLLNNKLCEVSLDNLQYKMLSIIPDENIIIYEVSGECINNLIYECSNVDKCPILDDAEACKKCNLAAF